MTNTIKYILASGSPRRKQLMEQMNFKENIDFKIITSNYEEDMTLDMNPTKLAKFLSNGKTEDVINQINKKPELKIFQNTILIGCDTFVVLNKKLLGKPKDLTTAKQMIKDMSGQTHEVISGITITNLKTNKTIQKAVTTQVTFKELTNNEIDYYINTSEVLDKAGAYAIQDYAGTFITQIKGEYFNIMGFPICTIKTLLEEIEK